MLGGQTLPLVALLLFGGVWADRLPRHRIMIAADLTRAALHALLAVLILSGAVQIWQLVAIEACFGAAQAFFQPAYSGLIPQTVPEPLIQEARALTESMANLAFLLGPALATVLVLGVGAGETFAFDASTFVLSALLLARVHPRPRGESAAAGARAGGAARGLVGGALAPVGVGDDRGVHRQRAVRVRAVVLARARDRARPLLSREYLLDPKLFSVWLPYAGNVSRITLSIPKTETASVELAEEQHGPIQTSGETPCAVVTVVPSRSLCCSPSSKRRAATAPPPLTPTVTTTSLPTNPGTPLEVLEPLLDELELILILAVNPGWGGQKFIASNGGESEKRQNG